MGHYVAVIILLGVLVSGAFLGIAMEGDSRHSERLVQEYDFELLARDVAQTGLSATVRHLAESYNMGSWTTGTPFQNEPFDGGRFTTTVTANDPVTGGTSGDTVDVVARGWMGPAQHVIFARYARDKDDVGIPPAFKYAIVSDQLMQVSGSMYIGSTNDTLNASIHTNDVLTNNGNNFTVEGFGTYTGSTDIKPQHGDNFQPNVDYNGPAPNYHEADSVHIQPLNWDRLRDVAGDPGAPGEETRSGSYVAMTGSTPFTVDDEVIDFTDPNSSFWDRGDVTYGCGAATCGTEENPYVLFIDGPAEFINTVKIIGHGYVVASGTITVSPQGINEFGNAGGIYGQLNDKTESTVILATQSDMEVTANACFGLGPRSQNPSENKHCHMTEDGTAELTHYEAGITVYVENGISFNGTPYVVGGVVAKNSTFDDTGDAIIRYASPNEGTLDLGFEYIIPIGPILIAYSEF